MKRVLAACAAVALVAGCGAGAREDHGFQDAPPDLAHTDNGYVQIINFPDGFPNIAMKCDHHGNLVEVTTREYDPPHIEKNPICAADWPAPKPN